MSVSIDDLNLPSPSDLLLEQWLGLIDDINRRVKQLDREIERMAKVVPETELLMTVPGISSYSGLMIHAELGEIDRFDEAGQVVRYAGLDPSVQESGNTRHEGRISKEGSSYLRWILVQCAQTAVHTVRTRISVSSTGDCVMARENQRRLPSWPRPGNCSSQSIIC